MKIIVLSLVFFCSLNLCHAQSGMLDPSFGTKGIVSSDLGSPFNYSSVGRQVLIQSDGSFYVVTQSAAVTIIIKKHADGSTDLSYGLNGYSISVPIYTSCAAFQTDGKIVMVGSVSRSYRDNGSDFAIARVNIDGSLDTSFHVNGWLTGDFLGQHDFSTSVTIQGDGKILVVVGTEWLTDFQYIEAFQLVRYNTDGSLDGQYISNWGSNNSVSAVAIQSDGKIVVSGDSLQRFNIDLTLDSTFNGNGNQSVPVTANDMAIQPDGKIIIAGGHLDSNTYIITDFVVARFNTNGSPDTTFGEGGMKTTGFGGSNEWPASLYIQTDGNIILAGSTGDGNQFNLAISRYDRYGNLDSTFSGDGKQTTDLGFPGDHITSLALQSDGKIFLSGYTNDGTNNLASAVRYDTDGTLDNTFEGDGILIYQISQGSTFYTTTSIQTDGKVVAAGYTWNGSNYDFVIVRYNTNGSLDLTFSGDGIQMTDFGSSEDKISAMEIQQDGKIVVAGSAGDNFGIARYNTDGSPDISFDNDGIQTTDFGSVDFVSSLGIQTDGKILAGGSIIARFNTDGSLDMSFHGDGTLAVECTDMAIQSDGRIVVINGNGYPTTVHRYNINGSTDSTFGNGGQQYFYTEADYTSIFGTSIAIQPDGMISMSGWAYNGYKTDNTGFAVTRLNTDGSIDPTFNGGWPFVHSINEFNQRSTIAVQTNNQIILAGSSYTSSNYAFTLARYNADGVLDNAFNNGGIVVTEASPANDRIAGMAIGENKLYAAGFGQYHGNLGVVARYLLGPEGGPWDSPFITAANGDWNDPNTWIGGIVPYSTSKVIVQHNVTITSNITCYSLNVETAAGYLIINTGLNLTITH